MNRIKALLFLAIILAMPIAALAAPVGTITALEGNVDITAGEKAARTAKLGDSVSEGDILRAKSKSKAQVTFLDGNILRLAEGTRVRITDYQSPEGKTTTLDLFRGKTQNIVSGLATAARYEVRTPAAVCGVRGTNFIVFFQDGVSGFMPREGTIYGYNRTIPEQVKVVTPGHAIMVLAAGQPATIQAVPFSDVDRHIRDTTPRITQGEQGKDEGAPAIPPTTVAQLLPSSRPTTTTTVIPNLGPISSPTTAPSSVAPFIPPTTVPYTAPPLPQPPTTTPTTLTTTVRITTSIPTTTTTVPPTTTSTVITTTVPTTTSTAPSTTTVSPSGGGNSGGGNSGGGNSGGGNSGGGNSGGGNSGGGNSGEETRAGATPAGGTPAEAIPGEETPVRPPPSYPRVVRTAAATRPPRTTGLCRERRIRRQVPTYPVQSSSAAS